jgi:hypothetical protein
MSLPTTFGTLTAATGGELDGNFQAVGVLTTIPCTLTGTNALVLAQEVNTPTISSYNPLLRLSAIIQNNNTGAVTAALGSLPVLPVYKDTSSGPTALSGSELQAKNQVVLVYDSALNSGGGGFHMSAPSTGSAGTVTSITAGTGLSGGTITASGTIALAAVSTLTLLANSTGGSAVPTANTLTAYLDAVFGTTQGSVLYRGASAWAELGPGTSGQFLETQGAGANPQWATPVAQTNTTWTPTDASGAGLSFTGVSASYTQIGNMVFYYAQLTYPTTASGSNAAIGGLPVNVANANYAQNYGSAKSAGVSTLQLTQVVKNAATMNLLTSASAAVTNTTLSTNIVVISGFYPVA